MATSTDPQALLANPLDPNATGVQTTATNGGNTSLMNSAPASPSASVANSTALAPAPVPPVASFMAAAGTASPASATGYQATPYAVDPFKGTVQGQVQDIIKNDSPLMQQARSSALRTANDRGLLNSSLAAGMGEQAVIAQALPIAQADAASQNTAMTNTANAQNAAGQFGAAAQNATSQTNAQLITSMNATNANAVNAQLSQEAQAANTRALAVIDNNTKTSLAVLQSNNQQLLQTNVNAANMYSQAVQAIANITTNANLDANAKATAVQSQINLLNEGLRTTNAISATDQAAIGSLNLGQFFQNAPGLTGTTIRYPGANGQLFLTQEEANQSLANAPPPPQSLIQATNGQY